MTEPLVSVLIPAYNGERFLKTAVRSALDQSYKNIEVIVGDDASTDRTPEILAALAAGDPRLRVIRHEANVGGFENPRLLFGEAQGEYVKYLLHDDVLAPDCIRVLVRGLQATPGAVMAFSRRNLVNEDGRPIPGGELKPLQDKAGPIDGWELGNACLEAGSNIIGELTTVLFRKDAVTTDFMWQVDGRRLDVLGDLSLWLRLLARGPVFYSPQALSRFRQHSTQTSQDPRLIARGIRDWPRLLDWAVRQGFLTDTAQQRRAFARILAGAAARVHALAEGPAFVPSLEAVVLATARLVELGARNPGALDRPLEQRAHGEQALAHLAQELDVWFDTFPVAVATATADAEAVRTAVRGFRDVQDAGAATRFVLAVEPGALEQCAPLVADADAGADLDIELVPTDSPASLFRTGWLAVTLRDDTWHEGRADAVWYVDPPRVLRGGRSSVDA
ncbi:glycosyltransferase family 2 protein [Petropleomorpha daqingensis]|uniref:Glycosyltransferase involved in cell wall biosynthesis n=1 Tax=Petropleomorpha daqingensis TaxID=2026353 RepID=A0A853CJA1_9ACTN|nr:glycosyltransferase involved in cell wall biosynthesis [Petropleomorpha daqingensis]